MHINLQIQNYLANNSYILFTVNLNNKPRSKEYRKYYQQKGNSTIV